VRRGRRSRLPRHEDGRGHRRNGGRGAGQRVSDPRGAAKASRPRPSPEQRADRSQQALTALEGLRASLLREVDRIAKEPAADASPSHICCTRARNQMRISPLEARAIAEALRSEKLREHLPSVLERLRQELDGLADSSARQNFDCPLLEGTRCLVHRVAKPIGCLAWNSGRDFSTSAWDSFASRDVLNDEQYGPDWKLRVIPLWLRRVLAEELAKAPTR